MIISKESIRDQESIRELEINFDGDCDDKDDEENDGEEEEEQ